jgi:beta-N-acetylhexosaminidase
MQAAIYGLGGERLTSDERAFFKDADPAGFILFRRNCVDKAQLRALTDELRSLHGRDDVPILIDQEGGRVARLQPPVWPAFPAAGRFSDLYQKAPISAIEAARVNAQTIGLVLREAGVNVNCAPVLDLRQPGGHDIVGDRAFGSEPMQVAALGRAVLDGMQAAGVIGILKHMPGHGRAMSDSHAELPVVTVSEEELELDLAPFRSLKKARIGMVAHLVYTAWDPENCASLSSAVIRDVVRKRIGFDGLLLSDDLGMHALSGCFGDRGRGVIAAGCDLALHCSAVMEEMVAVANAVGEMSEPGRERLDRAMAGIAGADESVGYEELTAKRDALLAYA